MSMYSIFFFLKISVIISVGINFANQIIKFIIQESVLELTNKLTIEISASKWGKRIDGLVQNIVWLDSSKCNKVNSFFNSLRRVPPSCFHFSLYCCRKPSIVFETAGTCSLLVSSIFHFLSTNFGRRPLIFWKSIKGSLHLICIINRLHKQATSKQCKKQDAGDILRFCPRPPIQQKPGYLGSPWVLWNALFSCCFTML